MNYMAVPGVSIFNELILEKIEKEFCTSRHGFLVQGSGQRKAERVIPRQVYMYALVEIKDRLGFTFDKLKEYTGGWHHASFIHSHRVINETYMNDPEYGERIRSVVNYVKQLKDGL